MCKKTSKMGFGTFQQKGEGRGRQLNHAHLLGTIAGIWRGGPSAAQLHLGAHPAAKSPRKQRRAATTEYPITSRLTTGQ